MNTAIAYYHKNGLEEAIKTFSDLKGSFCKKYEYGHWGINVATSEGVLLASCKYPGLVGVNILAWRSLVNQDLLDAAALNPYGAQTGEKVTNLNPMTGKQSAYRHFARVTSGLIFFTTIYDSTPMHKELPLLEDIKSAQDPKNAKPLNLEDLCQK